MAIAIKDDKKKQTTWNEVPIGTVFTDNEGNLCVKTILGFKCNNRDIKYICLTGTRCNTSEPEEFTIIPKGTLLEIV